MGIQSRKGMETHNCRTSREDGIRMGSWTATYGFFVMKQGGVDPDEVQHGGVPILWHNQARRNTKNFRKSYSNEEGEHCVATL